MPELAKITNEDAQVAAIAKLPERLAIVRMENDSMASMAAARPRDHKLILAEVKAQITAYPSFARAAMYSKPVGKDDSGRMKHVRGLSVRAAEALRNAYGFNKVHTEIEPLGDDAVRITATFTDFQAGNIWTDSGILSKFYKTRDGGRRRYDDDRFYNVVVKAEVSRRVREVVLRSVPPGLKAELEEAIEDTVRSLLGPSLVQKILTTFARKGVTQEMIEKHLEKKVAEWDQDDRLNLQGIFNAIEEGETTVAEAFGGTAGAAGSENAPASTAAGVKDAVEKARGKAQDVADAPQAGAPPRHEQIAIMLAEKDGCDVQKAMDRLEGFAKKLFGKPLSGVTKAALDSIEAKVKSGEISTNES